MKTPGFLKIGCCFGGFVLCSLLCYKAWFITVESESGLTPGLFGLPILAASILLESDWSPLFDKIDECC